MPQSPHTDTTVLVRLREKVEAARQEFEFAPECEKVEALLRLDQTVNDLTDALLNGRVNT